MFNIAQAVLDGTEKTLVTFGTNTEGTVHSATLDNTTGSDVDITFTIGTVSFVYKAAANSKTSISERLNLPANSTITVNGATGVTVTASYIEQAIDPNAALNQAETLLDNSILLASQWASEAEDVLVNGEDYSAKHYAAKAAESESNAAASESNAATSETNAATSESNAAASEANALTYKNEAETARDQAASVSSGDIIDDAGAYSDLTWSSSKISAELDSIESVYAEFSSTTIFITQTVTAKITNFDSYTTYNVSTALGAATIDGDTVTYTAPATAGTETITINGREIVFEIQPAGIEAPTILSPTDGALDQMRSVTFDMSAFNVMPVGFDTHEGTTVEVATDSSFTNIIATEVVTSGDLTSVLVDGHIESTQYHARAKYTGATLESDWSAIVSYTTTDTYVDTPSITSPLDGATDVPEQPMIELSAFNVVNGTDTQASSSVRIKDSGGTIVWETTVTSSMDSITTAAGILQEGELEYTIEAKHTGDTYGSSAWSAPITITTSASFVPDFESEIGAPYGGGYVAGKIVSDYDGQTYGLIVSDGSGDSIQVGDGTMMWRTARTAVASTCGTPPMTLADGRANHNAILALNDLANFPAFQWIEDNCNAVSLNGHDDWYLPSRDELELIYRNMKPTTQDNDDGTRITDDCGGDGATHGTNDNSLPTGAGYTLSDPAQTSLTSFQATNADALEDSFYWSSSEFDASDAWRQYFSNGGQYHGGKDNGYRVRAVRRVAL